MTPSLLRLLPRRALGIALALLLVDALAACSSAPASSPTPTVAPGATATAATATGATTALPTTLTTPTDAPTATPIPDRIMTTGSATISVTDVGVATVKNVAPLATDLADTPTISPDGIVKMSWQVLENQTAGGADFLTSLDLTFKPDPSGTTRITNGERVVIGQVSYPVKALMYVTSDQYSFDTTADGGNGHPAQADCTVTSARSASGGVSGTVTCAGTFFIPATGAHRSFKANATFWAEPAGGVGPPG